MNKTRTTQTPGLDIRRALPTFASAVSLALFLIFGSISGPAGSQVDAAQPGPRLALAIEAQRSLIDETPSDPALYSDLGNLLTLDQQWVGAEEAYRSSLSLNADYAPAQFNLALLLHRRGDLEEAKSLLQSVIAQEPDNAWAHYQLGRIFHQLDDRRSAIESYADAFAADPELTFPDVNPHLADNALATEAILKVDASRVPVSPDTAPRNYNDASRIIDLLVPAPVTAESTEATVPEAESEQRSTSSLDGGTAGLVTPQAELEQDDPLPTRSLNNEDLNSLGSPNQASPQPGSNARTPRGAVTTPRGSRSPIVRGGVPAQGVPATPAQGGQPGASPAAPSDTPQINRSRPRPRPGTGFRPGSRSSAQLHLELERPSGGTATPAP